jgi:dihydroorotate dehydrogenase
MDAEEAHHFTFNSLKALFSVPGLARVWGGRSAAFAAPVECMGLRFRNPVGLAAGFDKDAELGDIWADLGFGFVEFGTVTPRPQPGNPKPRLFRLIEDEAIINRMGFNNQGAEALARKIDRMHRRDLIVGVNIGKNKDTSLEQAPADYRVCMEMLHDQGDYFVVNVSSPNTPGLRQLQDKDKLTEILDAVQGVNQSRPTSKPLLLKIAPDLTHTQLEEAADAAIAAQFNGIIATNTTITRIGLLTAAERVSAIGAGGLSGAPLTQMAESVLAHLKGYVGDKLTLIGVGGIDSGETAVARKHAGAALVQLYSGYVYQGPGLVREVVKAWKKDFVQ